MTLYAKPINRPLALEGWFEKPKNRLFGHVVLVVVVTNFVRNVIIEINNVIMKIKWRERER